MVSLVQRFPPVVSCARQGPYQRQTEVHATLHGESSAVTGRAESLDSIQHVWGGSLSSLHHKTILDYDILCDLQSGASDRLLGFDDEDLGSSPGWCGPLL